MREVSGALEVLLLISFVAVCLCSVKFHSPLTCDLYTFLLYFNLKAHQKISAQSRIYIYIYTFSVDSYKGEFGHFFPNDLDKNERS